MLSGREMILQTGFNKLLFACGNIKVLHLHCKLLTKILFNNILNL